MHNPADIPTRAVSCEENLRKWFDRPEIFYRENIMSVEFDIGERLKLVDEMVKSELKDRGFSRLRDVKPVRQNELYKNILIELSNNATVKQTNANIGNVINLLRYSSFEKLINITCFVFPFLENFSCTKRKTMTYIHKKGWRGHTRTHTYTHTHTPTHLQTDKLQLVYKKNKKN